MGDPGARLFTSPLPQPTLSTSCFSHPPPPHPSPPPQVKKSDRARPRQLLGSIPSPPQSLPGPHRVPAPPAPILSPDDSHRCSGGLTAEATGVLSPPPPASLSVGGGGKRERKEREKERALRHPPTPPDWEKPAFPDLRPPGITQGSGKAAAPPPLGEVGPPGKPQRSAG